ncbi:retrovirus-related Pol polyprotein from transposon opus, partial [Trichonephila clavipes]
CPTCNLNASQRTDVATNHINAYKAQTRSPRLTLIDITFCGIKGRVCADTGSSHSIAGERVFQIFKDNGLLFQETTLAMSLADGQQTTGEALTTQVMVEIEGRSVLTNFIILPKAKGNRTLLGTYFLSSAGLVLDVKNTCWYFWDNPIHKYPFGEELDTPSIVEKMSNNTCQLREGEGESLTSVCVCAQKEKLNLLLESFQNIFEPGGTTNILEHHINTGNSHPISVLPYRMSPVKNCPDCIKYKASNQKPSGLLQTPVSAQRFETLTIDLFGPLPESKDGKKWIIIIEDCTTKWVELFALPNAIAKDVLLP